MDSDLRHICLFEDDLRFEMMVKAVNVLDLVIDVDLSWPGLDPDIDQDIDRDLP